MSDDPLADPRPPLQTNSSPAPDDHAPEGARAAESIVAEASRRLETFMELAARQREKLSAAEKLLVELDAARAKRD